MSFCFLETVVRICYFSAIHSCRTYARYLIDSNKSWVEISMADKRKIDKNYGKWFLQEREAEIPGTLLIDYQAHSLKLTLYSKVNFLNY